MKHLKGLSFVIVVFLLCSACLLLCPGCKKKDTNGGEPEPAFPDVPLPAYWPTAGWQSTYPEQQGMDSGRLADMLEYIQTQQYHIRSALVIRNGYLVTEAYFFPFQEGFWHSIHSCTKSFLSALVGIAINQGFIENEESNVLDFFPEYDIANLDQWKEAMQLKHLLKMASGMDARDSYLYNRVGLYNMTNSSDWSKYVLDLPMINAPGSTFDYSNGASFLIASILHRTTQKNGLDFAHENLFSRLGVPASQVDWEMSPRGIAAGFGRMRIRPVDMAKFGFLYLHKGVWAGSQLVPKSWVEKSTQRQITANTLSENYGFQWWIDDRDYYMAMGYAGQYIFVNPGKNLIVVFTSAFPENDVYIPEALYNQYILDAVRSDETLPDDAGKQARLDEIIRQIASPEAEPVPALPDTAAAVSGKLFYFEPNDYGYHYIGLTFTPGSDEALFRFSYRDRDLELPLGLDDVYRVTFQFDYWRAFKGRWENDSAFAIDYQIADYSEWGGYRLTFAGNKVTVQYRSDQTDSQWEVTAYSN